MITALSLLVLAALAASVIQDIRSSNGSTTISYPSPEPF